MSVAAKTKCKGQFSAAVLRSDDSALSPPLPLCNHIRQKPHQYAKSINAKDLMCSDVKTIVGIAMVCGIAIIMFAFKRGDKSVHIPNESKSVSTFVNKYFA